MSPEPKQLSSPASTGGLGTHFENRVQSSFVVLMLTGGFAPCMETWPITKIKLQGRYQNFDTDDLIVYTKQPGTDRQAKLLGQIKHSISITKGNKEFGEVIQAAWNDFNNKDVFTEGTDTIALICGPLSATDTDGVRALLRQAKHSEDAVDFIKRIELGRFTGGPQRDKFEVFKHHLKVAKDNNDLTKEELYRFLKSYNLLIYDLDIKGVTLSLLHSLIGQYSSANANALWAQVTDNVEWESENAGSITPESIPEGIRSAFERRPTETIPSELYIPPPPHEEKDWNQSQYASELAIANIIGSWNENSASDKVIISQLAREEYSDWIPKLRNVLHQPDSPISLKNGIWSVTDRKVLWPVLGAGLFDDNLDNFKKCAVDILIERDPMFDLPPDERYAASIHGKVLKYSQYLRRGLSESLALLGSNPDALTNCSLNKPETIAVLAVREIFENADWELWGSLNNLLPLFAEAAPNEFINIIETALQQTPCPFDELFLQEGSGITGGNYMAGLLWALETLAWDEKYLSRVTVILGELATLDPGGNWANRPANSLAMIFLPWTPQTTASVEKRQVAIRTLQNELPDIAWKLLLSLLPKQHQVSTGSHKPIWRETIPEDWSKDVSKQEYWNQVSYYVNMAVEIAEEDTAKLTELIGYLDNLPQSNFDELLRYLESDEIIEKPEDERFSIWTKVVDFTLKHKRHSNAKWALGPEIVSKIDEVAKALAPTDPMKLHQRLFSGRDFDLYEEQGDWREQQKLLGEHRQQAIKDILGYGGIDAVLQFAETVKSPSNVGHSLGFVDEPGIDTVILPSLLETEHKNLMQLASGYIRARQHSQGWKWVDNTDTTSWSQSQIGWLLVYLPFIEKTWKRANVLLGDSENEYWKRANVNPYQADCELLLAIDKLIEYDRPNAAIDCLFKILHDKQPLDKDRTVHALLSAVSSDESSHIMDTYQIVEIIKALQDAPDTNPEDLFRVEWAYLPLLDRHSGASPKLLEKRLSSNPDFFCETIRLIYKSKKEPKTEKEPTEQEKAIATNAWRLLHEWKTPPGMDSNGDFSESNFNQWLESVKKTCTESGHFEVALSHVGNVLIYTPSDSDGLWINHAVAEALNSKDADEIRNGFCMGIFNSRGAHIVDPTGKTEKELAAKYRKQAEEVENAGYQRFAATLRELADSYEREAKRYTSSGW